MYYTRELITQLWVYASVIRILAKGYLPNTLVTPSKLKEILSVVKTALETYRHLIPDYNLVIDSLHLYYDMQLITIGIDKDKNLIYTISNIHTAIHTTTTDTVSIRNSTSSHHRSQYTGEILHHTYKLKNHTLH